MKTLPVDGKKLGAASSEGERAVAGPIVGAGFSPGFSRALAGVGLLALDPEIALHVVMRPGPND